MIIKSVNIRDVSRATRVGAFLGIKFLRTLVDAADGWWNVDSTRQLSTMCTQNATQVATATRRQAPMDIFGLLCWTDFRLDTSTWSAVRVSSDGRSGCSVSTCRCHLHPIIKYLTWWCSFLAFFSLVMIINWLPRVIVRKFLENHEKFAKKRESTATENSSGVAQKKGHREAKSERESNIKFHFRWSMIFLCLLH
jgi:hypothetical protein